MTTTAAHRHRGLWAYNLRILLGHGYWLIVTPIVVAQLALFWSIATSSLANLPKAVQTIELLAPILSALLCAYAVAPEYAGVSELVFVRPISIEKLLLQRLAAIFAFLLVLLIPPLVICRLIVPGFPVLPAVLSGLVSALFLSALAMALASATRQPLIGLGVAGAFWACDLLLGSQFNPLLTLHTFSDYLGRAPMSELWLYGKLALLLLAALLYAWNRRLLGRPAAPRRARAVFRQGLLVLAILLGYVSTGAAGKLAYIMRNEAALGNQAWMSYQQAFRVYGPLPVPWLFGPAFPLYLQAELGHPAPLLPTAAQTPQALKRVKLVLDRYPNSIWADNAAFELARSHSHTNAAQATTFLIYRAGQEPLRQVIESGEMGMAEALLSFAEQYPRSPFAPLALSQRAKVGEAWLDFTLATDAYQRLLQGYPSSRQAAEAGLALNTLYARQGKTREALRAAQVAARASRWDLKPYAYLTAARSAQAAGDTALARDYLRQARVAAEAARRRAGERVRGGDTELSPARIILQSEAVAREADQALARGLPSASARPSGAVPVVGRLIRNDQGFPAARVAIGEQPGDLGYPTPFTSLPSAQAVTDADGSFTLTGLSPGSYQAIAFALPGWYQRGEIMGLTLPVPVSAPRTVLPPLSLVPQTMEAPPTPSSSGANSSGRGGGGGRRGDGRNRAASGRPRESQR